MGTGRLVQALLNFDDGRSLTTINIKELANTLATRMSDNASSTGLGKAVTTPSLTSIGSSNVRPIGNTLGLCTVRLSHPFLA